MHVRRVAAVLAMIDLHSTTAKSQETQTHHPRVALMNWIASSTPTSGQFCRPISMMIATQMMRGMGLKGSHRPSCVHWWEGFGGVRGCKVRVGGGREAMQQGAER